MFLLPKKRGQLFEVMKALTNLTVVINFAMYMCIKPSHCTPDIYKTFYVSYSSITLENKIK